MHALVDVDLDIPAGRFTAVMGPSGSGKSTLMHCLAGLDTPTAGTVTVAGVEITGLKDNALTAFRRDHIGFVFQAFNLLPMLTARQNILLPLELAGTHSGPEWLDLVVDVLGIARPAPRTGPTSSPAASSSGSPWPGVSWPGRPCSSPTSRPATSTATPPRRCSASCDARCASSARPSSW